MNNKLIHITQWVFMTLFVFDYHWFETTWYEAMGYAVLEVLGYMAIFYANLWVLNKWKDSPWLYKTIASLGIIILYILVIQELGWDTYFYESSLLRNLFSIALNALLFTGLAYLFYHTENYFSEREQNLALANRNKQLQIESLKARINPHFLFNTLNNLNALILKKDDKVPTYLSKLSSILRYSVDDGEQKTLPLQKEIDHLQAYLDLICLQEPATENIDFYVEGETEDLHIIPFVLMTLLENAIKHSDIMYNEEGLLHVNISIEEEFVVEIVNTIGESSNTNTGMGLQNVLAQLDLAYGTGFQFRHGPSEDVYICQLNIMLNELESA